MKKKDSVWTGEINSRLRVAPQLSQSSDSILGVYQVLPSQFFDTTGRHALTGEQRLMAALLADAINVFCKGVNARSVRKRLLYIDAERWINGHRASRHAFSFETVCDALGLDSSVVRRKMIGWKHAINHDGGEAARSLRLKFTPRHQRMSQRPRSPRPPRAF